MVFTNEASFKFGSKFLGKMSWIYWTYDELYMFGYNVHKEIMDFITSKTNLNDASDIKGMLLKYKNAKGENLLKEVTQILEPGDVLVETQYDKSSGKIMDLVWKYKYLSLKNPSTFNTKSIKFEN